MKTEHTPGPWYFNPRNDPRQPQIASETTGHSIAVVYDHTTDDEKRANARLIAAAPDLLEAAEALLEAIGDDFRVVDMAEVMAMHAAISKAKGDV